MKISRLKGAVNNPLLAAVCFIAARKEGRIGRRPKLKVHQERKIIHLVSSGEKTTVDAARLFSVHTATVLRLLARSK